MDEKAKNYLLSCIELGWTSIRKDSDTDIYLVKSKKQEEYKLNESSLRILKDVAISLGTSKIKTIINKIK